MQKAIAQLKLAFDNLEKQQPALSRDVLTQMFDLIVSSRNPDVTSLMPPSVATALLTSTAQPPSLPDGWPLPPS